MTTATTAPNGRLVILDARTYAHLARRRPQMLRHVGAILSTVHRPDFEEDDPAAERVRFFRRDLNRRRWLRVVVDFSESPAFVVTAFAQSHEPNIPSR